MITNGVASEYELSNKKVEIWDMAYKSPKTVRDTFWDIYQQGRADAIEEYTTILMNEFSHNCKFYFISDDWIIEAIEKEKIDDVILKCLEKVKEQK